MTKENGICCSIAPFDLNQKVFLYDESGMKEIGNCTFTNLGKSLAELCMGYEVNKIYLTNAGEFASKIIEDIKIRSNFSKYDIEVEILN